MSEADTLPSNPVPELELEPPPTNPGGSDPPPPNPHDLIAIAVAREVARELAPFKPALARLDKLELTVARLESIAETLAGLTNTRIDHDAVVGLRERVGRLEESCADTERPHSSNGGYTDTTEPGGES